MNLRKPIFLKRCFLLLSGMILLTACGRDENWLRKQLSREKISSPREVFLLTLDERGQVFCVRKEREA